MIGSSSLTRVTGLHPRLLNAALAALVGGGGVLYLLFGRGFDGESPSGADAVAVGAALLLVLARCRAPLLVLALAVLVEAAFTVLVSRPSPVLGVSVLISVYTVARTARRRVAVIAALVTAAALYAVVVPAMELTSRTEGAGVFAWVGMCAAVGGTVRTWRDYLAATEERAVRAEASKEEEARRRVAGERLRIARELHDVIAHHIALITLQAGVARHLLRSEPDQADTALGHIREAGRDVLDELSSLLYVLRQPDDETHAPQPAEPVPGMSRLGRLLESMSTAGLSVRHRQAGPWRPLPTAVDLAAYRIVQEGLTNAHKHGTHAGADLLVEYRPDALHIEISNPVRAVSLAAPAPAGTGHGLRGMRERAHAAGGRLHAGADPDGRFRLSARLPLPQPEVSAEADPSRRHVTAPCANGVQEGWR
ncbi:sensor histidine kinase [Streptomyces coeruleorubidus]|uniref:sensor histidine kinase n=1 Tax=Streptomyces coeruleorubidus TaxID=116188 RepID=UPI0033AC5DC9